MTDHLILFDDDFGDDDNVYNQNNNEYDKCINCSLILYDDKPHCCACGNKWINKKQLYCDRCYKSGLVYFSMKDVNITPFISKFNGVSTIQNIEGITLYFGEIKNGKYHGKGVLYSPKTQKHIYVGDFQNGEYCGFGSVFEDRMMKVGIYEKSKIMDEYKTLSLIKDNEIPKDCCNICYDDYDETELFPLCGLKNCCYCCAKCIKYHFDNLECGRGSKLNKNMLNCLFCRNRISNDIIKIYCPTLYGYIDHIEKIKDPKEVVLLCSECEKNEVRKLNEECGEYDNREKYICEECMECKNLENVKKCPNCGMKVQRVSGCHWMLCTSKECNCKVAWCWHCLKTFDATEYHDVNCKHCGQGM
jgi:MORN repeat